MATVRGEVTKKWRWCHGKAEWESIGAGVIDEDGARAWRRLPVLWPKGWCSRHSPALKKRTLPNLRADAAIVHRAHQYREGGWTVTICELVLVCSTLCEIVLVCARMCEIVLICARLCETFLVCSSSCENVRDYTSLCWDVLIISLFFG